MPAPSFCPACHGTALDRLAQVPRPTWRCRTCSTLVFRLNPPCRGQLLRLQRTGTGTPVAA